MGIPRSAPRWAGVLVAAFAFGLLDGWAKGIGDGLRAGIGNLSAPWLLVAVVPAWRAGSLRRGAAVGLAATMAALLGFYAGCTLVMRDHLGFDTSYPGALRYVIEANRLWFAAGLLSGPLCGALAAWLGRRSPGRLLGVAALLLTGEIVAVWAVAGRRLPLIGVGWGVSSWAAYRLELVLGLALAATVAVREMRLRRRSR